jgi:hypothetical protein
MTPMMSDRWRSASELAGGAAGRVVHVISACRRFVGLSADSRRRASAAPADGRVLARCAP